MKQLITTTLLATISLVGASAQMVQQLLIGTYTNSGSHGIYIAQFNAHNGQIRIVDSLAADNPSYLAVNKQGNRLYAIIENGGNTSGAATAFYFDSTSHHWRPFDATPVFTGGDHPCFISVDEDNRFLAVANYTGGSLAILSLNENGSIGKLVQLLQQQGSSVNLERQQSAHVHTAVFSPHSKRLFIADLGSDRITAFSIDAQTNEPIDSQKVLIASSAPGAGPRHIAFHPKQPLFYVMEELSGKITVYREGKRNLKWKQSILSDNVSREPGSADIHVSADGKYLYASHRADANLLSSYSIHPKTGLLTSLGSQSTLGIGPRNFVIDPSGKFLLVANQRSNNIVVFAIDDKTGIPSPTGHSIVLPAPVCLIFSNR